MILYPATLLHSILTSSGSVHRFYTIIHLDNISEHENMEIVFSIPDFKVNASKYWPLSRASCRFLIHILWKFFSPCFCMNNYFLNQLILNFTNYFCFYWGLHRVLPWWWCDFLSQNLTFLGLTWLVDVGYFKGVGLLKSFQKNLITFRLQWFSAVLSETRF